MLELGASTTDRVAADLNSGERVTLQVPAETRTLVVHCPKAMGGYEASRIDYDFKAHPAAYFVLTAQPECVNIQPVDAKAAASLTRQTRERAARPLVYDPAPRPAAAAASVASAAPIAGGDPAGSVVAATAAWVEAFNSRDPARILSSYDPDALLWETSAQRLASGAAAIGEYFKSAPQRPGERVTLGEQHVRVYGDTAVDSGTYTFWLTRDGKIEAVPARYSLVYRNRGGKWLIVDHHSSRVPFP